jgi:hypothetical protein
LGNIAFYDTAKAYSALQYVEGIWLASEIILRNLVAGKRKIKLFFLLPKGEIDYYRSNKKTPDDSFQQDLCNFLELILDENNGDVQVQLSFQEFEYCAMGTTRPYVRVKSDVDVDSKCWGTIS